MMKKCEKTNKTRDNEQWVVDRESDAKDARRPAENVTQVQKDDEKRNKVIVSQTEDVARLNERQEGEKSEAEAKEEEGSDKEGRRSVVNQCFVLIVIVEDRPFPVWYAQKAWEREKKKKWMLKNKTKMKKRQMHKM